MASAVFRPEAIAFTTRLAPLTASPQAKIFPPAICPFASVAMFFRASVASWSSFTNPSCSGCRKPMARNTKSASITSRLPVGRMTGRPPSGAGSHSTSSTSTPRTLFRSPTKRFDAKLQRRSQPSSWLLVVFSILGYMGQGVAGL